MEEQINKYYQTDFSDQHYKQNKLEQVTQLQYDDSPFKREINQRYTVNESDFKTPGVVKLNKFQEISPQRQQLRLTQARPSNDLTIPDIDLNSVRESVLQKNMNTNSYFEPILLDENEQKRISKLTVTQRKSEGRTYKRKINAPSKFENQDVLNQVQEEKNESEKHNSSDKKLKINTDRQAEIQNQQKKLIFQQMVLNEKTQEESNIFQQNYDEDTFRQSDLSQFQVLDEQSIQTVNENQFKPIDIREKTAQKYLQKFIKETEKKQKEQQISQSGSTSIRSNFQSQKTKKIVNLKENKQKIQIPELSANETNLSQVLQSLNKLQTLDRKPSQLNIDKNQFSQKSFQNQQSHRTIFNKQNKIQKLNLMHNDDEPIQNVCGLERIFSLNDVVLQKEDNQTNQLLNQQFEQMNEEKVEKFTKQIDQFFTVPDSKLKNGFQNIQNSLNIDKQIPKQNSFWDNDQLVRDSIILRSEFQEVHLGLGSNLDFKKKHLTLQQNGKLIVHQNEDPLKDPQFIYSIENSENQNSIYHSQIKMINLWEQSGILQINYSKKCQIEVVLDLQFLFPGVKLLKYLNKERANQIDLYIYKFVRDDEQILLQQIGDPCPLGFKQEWNEPVFRIAIKFELKNQMEQFYDQLMKTIQKYKEIYGDQIEQQQQIQNREEIMCARINRQSALYGALLTQQTDFQNFCSITEEDFFKSVDTGDVLLFRSNNLLGTWLTRTLTQSHFDHVGIVLRFGEGFEDLYILEAVGEDGVRLNSWISARWYVGSYFDKIGYRKLNYELSSEQLKNFDNFRRNSTGKQYALNLKKIFTNKSEAQSYGQQANIKEDRQFFCSELVAKSLKVLGLLKDLEKSCTLYYPGCFEENQQIEKDLIDEASFSPIFNVLVDYKYCSNAYF